MHVVALVPAYQAAAQVGTVVGELLARWPSPPHGPAVLVVDDGSTDGTGEAARRAGAEVLRHESNLGKGAALRTGLRRAWALGAGAAVCVDADGQHPAEEALRLATHPASSTALLLGVRDLLAAGAPRPNRISNGISNFFLSIFAGRHLADTQCGLRRYPLPATLHLDTRAAGYAFEAEVILQAAHASWAIVEEPIRVIYPPAHERVSHFDVVRDPARIVATVLATLARRPWTR